MEAVTKLGWTLALVVVLAAFAGCGGGDSTSTADTVKQAGLYPWLKGPTRQFLEPGGDNVVQTFGEEGTAKERVEATAVISAWLRARAAKDWKKDCSYFSRVYAKQLTEDAHHVTGGRVKKCAQALAYFKQAASGDYVDTLTGSIDSLRIGEGQIAEGDYGFMAYAQYHGNDGQDWIVPLGKEGGEWKISHSRPFGRDE